MTQHATPTMLAIAFTLAFSLLPAARAAEDPEQARLQQRLIAIEADPARNTLAAYERLQARQALDALAAARSSQRPDALQIAQWRVETAELAASTEVARREIDRLERERSELLVEASRQDAARARQEAEIVLDDVAGAQAAKLRAARQREAELARREAELMKDLPPVDDDN